MQLKRIFVSLLVAIMILSLAVITVSAADTASTTFDIAVEVPSAAVVGEELLVPSGDTLEIKVVIENNPGAVQTQITIYYDMDVLTPVDVNEDGKFNSKDLVQGTTYNYTSVRNTVIKEENAIVIISEAMAEDSTVTGEAFTLKFTVADDYEGEVKLEYVAKANNKANNQLTTNAPASERFANVISALPHHLDVEKSETTEATCVEPAKISIPCADEGCEYVHVIQVSEELGDHTEEVIPAVAATCTETGLTEGKKCSVCGETTVAQEEIPAIGHTEEVIPAVDATCTETGLTEGKKCSVCGEILVAQEEIPATGHTEEVIPAVDATCTETGLTEGKKCSVCGETTVAQEEIPATGHTEEVIPAVAATCTETGLTEGKKCSVCGETTVAQETIAALGHTWTDATCTDAKTCSVCNATEGEANGHTYTNDCDADCDVCGETRTPAAHAYGEWKVVTEATKKAEGKQEKTCSVCGNVESEVIPMVKGGCNSVMGALAVVAMTMVGAAVVIRKKED